MQQLQLQDMLATAGVAPTAAGVAPPPPPPPPPRSCMWRFVTYHQSPVEAAWRQNIKHNQENVCDATRAFTADANVWTSYTASP